MMRRCAFLLCSAIQSVTEGLTVAKDYQKIQVRKKELMEAKRKEEEFRNYPLRYQILECRPGLPLALTKLKYLVACRRTHPDAGGDAEDFLRVSLAYQDVMKDYGVETVDNQVVNLGNFQSDDHEADNYVTARAHIQSYIPISTLEEHIRQIDEVRARLGDHLSDKLASNCDETMWLLEDIEDIMESTGLKTVKLEVLEDGKIHVAETAQLTDGTEKPLFLPEDVVQAAERAVRHDKDFEAEVAAAMDEVSAAAQREAEGGDDAQVSGEDAAGDDAAPGGARRAADVKEGNDSAEASAPGRAIFEATVSANDIEILNARNSMQDRTDVAGLASRTATEVMNNTEEVKNIRLGLGVLFTIFSACLITLYMSMDVAVRAQKLAESRPQVAEHIVSDTMLPWWGNDAEYESQVKRIFMEEWRRARATSRRAQTFQDGIARESLSDDEKKRMDLQIFTVTADRLRAMRDNADEHPSRK